MLAVTMKAKPWKQMALLLGWEDGKFPRVFFWDPRRSGALPRNIVVHRDFAPVFQGPRRWERAVKYTQRTQKIKQEARREPEVPKVS
jgi:hypothetical protein